MRILYLDDDQDAIEVFVSGLTQVYKSDFEVFPVTDLISFDEILYDGRQHFDGIVMDLGISDPIDIPLEAYEEWLLKIGISYPTFLMGNISVLGWDYYSKVMRNRAQTKNRLDTVLLKTGYADLLLAEYGKNCYAPATLLKKGDEEYDLILDRYLKKLEK